MALPPTKTFLVDGGSAIPPDGGTPTIHPHSTRNVRTVTDPPHATGMPTQAQRKPSVSQFTLPGAFTSAGGGAASPEMGVGTVCACAGRRTSRLHTKPTTSKPAIRYIVTVYASAFATPLSI